MAASPFSLERKVAIVTGGGVGIGRSIAVEFAKAGADVVICSRKKENLDPVVEEIKRLGRRSFCEVVDVRQEDAVKGLVERTVKEMGRLDIMVNNAGASFRAKVEDISANGWNTVINFTRELGMAWGRKGIRVNCIAPGPVETEGYLGVLTKQDPAAAKKAYDAVASRTGMGRWGKIHEIAYPCIFLASEASSFMTGATIIVDGGPSAREGDEAS